MEKCHICGSEEVSYGSCFRTTPLGVRAIYLQEFICEKCGRYVARGSSRDGYEFVRKGRIDDHGDDSDVLGGHWI